MQHAQRKVYNGWGTSGAAAFVIENQFSEQETTTMANGKLLVFFVAVAVFTSATAGKMSKETREEDFFC